MHRTEPATADDSHTALENTLWVSVNKLWSNASLESSKYSLHCPLMAKLLSGSVFQFEN